MGRVVLFVVLAGAVLIGGALLFAGAFPPNPPQQPVSHVLDNDRFKTN